MREFKEPFGKSRYHLFRIAIDPASPTPRGQQIYETLRAAIADGRLEPGTRLPSTRALAKRLRVSRNTVLDAYDSLFAEGLLIAKIGSGTCVRANAARDPLIPTPKKLRPRVLLRRAQYPSAPASFEDSDGNVLYAHR